MGNLAGSREGRILNVAKEAARSISAQYELNDSFEDDNFEWLPDFAAALIKVLREDYGLVATVTPVVGQPTAKFTVIGRVGNL